MHEVAMHAAHGSAPFAIRYRASLSWNTTGRAPAARARFRMCIDRCHHALVVDNGRPNIAIFWETQSLTGIVNRMDRPRYIARAGGVGTATRIAM